MVEATVNNVKARYRRRHYFIDRRFQGAFLLRFLAWTCLAAGVAGGELYFGVQATLEDHMYSAHFLVVNTGEIVRGQVILTNLMVAAALLLASVPTMLHILRKIDVILERARGGLERVAQGELMVRLPTQGSERLDGLLHELNASIAHARKQAEQAHAAAAGLKPDPSAQVLSAPERAARLRACAKALRGIGPQA